VWINQLIRKSWGRGGEEIALIILFRVSGSRINFKEKGVELIIKRKHLESKLNIYMHPPVTLVTPTPLLSPLPFPYDSVVFLS
jgi:hypothetical protein